MKLTANSLHIVNNDSIARRIRKAKLPGDVVVIREMFCDGPLHKQVGSDLFWKYRYAFFEEEWGLTKLEYYDNTIVEFLKLNDLAEKDEVVLWFEYDMFSQINLLTLCSYLLISYRKDVVYALTCVGRIQGKEGFFSLLDISIPEWNNAFEKRVRLSRSNLIYAEKCYTVFANNELEELKNRDFKESPKFPYLQAAMNAHLTRFPNKKGLNTIELQLLQIIDKTNEKTKIEILMELLYWQQKETGYGLGDIQLEKYLDKLQAYYEIKNLKYVLNENGKSAIQ